MAPQVLRELKSAVPFRPFVLHMADGKSISVPGPEFISINPGSGRTIFVWVGEDSFHILDSILIARVELALAGQNNPPSNGELTT